MGKQEEQEVDSRLENGPIDQRECRDILFCLLFLAAFGAMVAIGIYAYRTGDPLKLAVAYDADGNGCGIDGKAKDYKYIYFVAPWPGSLERTVCVKSCPTYQQFSLDINLDCLTNSKVQTCRQIGSNIKSFSSFSSGLNVNDPGFVLVYNTTKAFDRLCFPGQDVLSFTNLGSSVYVTQSEEWMSDVRNSWEIIFASAGCAIVIGFIYMVLLRYCSGVLTWLAILAYILGLFALGAILYDKGKTQAENYLSTSDTSSSSSNQSSSANTLKIAGYVLWGLGGLTIILVLCLFNKIRLAIAIIKTASMFVRDCPLVLLVPLFVMVFVVGWIAYWISAALYLYSIGDVSKSTTTPFASIKWDDKTRYLVIYFIFGGLWVNAFILAINQFIIASSTSIWYFSQQNPHAPISRSVYRAFRYHIGSLALGSLILAIVQFIRLVLTYVQYQLKKAKQDNGLVKCILCYCQCYMSCLERFIKFLNKNAYIQISITGKSFCWAAKDAFFLILRNPAKFGMVASIGELFMFLGKIFIAALGTICGFCIISYSEPWKSQLYSVVLPTIFFFIASMAIAILFMSVYGMAADTCLQCFIVDSELNKTKGRDPQNAPAPLREFMDNIEVKSRKVEPQ